MGGDATSQREGRQHAHMHNVWERVRRGGKWWWREVDVPARAARSAQELLHDFPMHTGVEQGSEIGGMTQVVQHARAHVGFVQACTFDGGGDRASEAQGRAGGTRGARSCEDGSGGARAVADSPGAERAPVRTPSVELRVAVSQKASQSAETNDFARRTRGWSGRGTEGDWIQTHCVGGRWGVTRDTGGG